LTPATLVLLPGLDGTEIFLQPLLGALPDGVRPLVVTYPLAGPNRYADLLAVVREAVAGIGEFHVLGWSFSGPLALMLAKPSRSRCAATRSGRRSRKHGGASPRACWQSACARS
jgi:pimeloyl-ACP methyl ester carboxylesterase